MKLLRNGAFALAICLLGIQLSAMEQVPETEPYITSVQYLGDKLSQDLLITVGRDPMFAGGAGEVQADEARFVSVSRDIKRLLRKPIPLPQKGSNMILVVVNRNTEKVKELFPKEGTFDNLAGKNQTLIIDDAGNVSLQQDI